MTEIKHQLTHQDELSKEDIDFLLSSPSVYNYYDVVKLKTHAPVKIIINWLKGTYQAALHEQGRDFNNPPVATETFANLLNRLADRTITTIVAKQIFTKLMTGATDLDAIIQAEGHEQVSMIQLEDIIRTVIENNPQQANDYRAGKEKLFSFFVGMIMKQTKGSADPADVNTLLRKYL